MLFTAASALCGLSNDIRISSWHGRFRASAARCLFPEASPSSAATFGEEERGRAIGTWSGFTSITAAIGPVLGGWLVEHASWRWIFFINLPLALIVLALIWRHVPESRGEDGARRLDWTGAVLAASVSAGSSTALIESSNKGWADPRW